MHAPMPPDDEDRINSLAVVLPLAVVGFVLAAACWSLFSVAGVYLRQALALGDVAFGLLLSVPMASGALLAIPAGLAARRYGARRVMMACLAGLFLCMLSLMLVDSLPGYLVAGAGLGLAGGYYSAGLQFVMSHAPDRHAGLVLGLFGAGITGVGLSYYLVPLVLDAFQWAVLPLAYLILLALLLALVVMLTAEEDVGDGEAAGVTSGPLLAGPPGQWHDVVWFGIVAGSLLALALWLPDYLSSLYQLPVQAGAGVALWFVVPGALAQIPGGWLADRLGSYPVVSQALVAALIALFLLSYPPMTLVIQAAESPIHIDFTLPLALETGLVVLLGVTLGCAMIGLQRKIILAYPAPPALVAGVLLVSACSVAFLLPLMFSVANHWLGIRSTTFMILFVVLTGSLLMFLRDHRRREREKLLHQGI
ncbi:nitrate/nitrite transporter [Marinobacter sp. M1N3S26]|uniref:MFS transporter n=1 Tax=unclassified Marinobacter TaxID=83889 RepID=UPI00387ABBD8